MEDTGKPRGAAPFGILLRSYRLAAGLSQEALAERAHMSTNGIGALERGYRRRPQRESIELLASALELDPERRQLFERAALRLSAAIDATPHQQLADGTNLPFSLSSFVGRESEVREIATLLGEHRLVTLTGSGGVGKTQTALRAGAAFNDRLGSVVALAELASLSDPALVPAAIAAALGLQETPDRSLLDSICAHLRNREQLLVLDNCEHVVTEAANAASAVLGNCPQVRILATSREPLRHAGERCYRLPSLSVPSGDAARRMTAANAASYPAITLFAQRARAVDRRFELNDDNAPVVAQICRELDGIPLAIELAAAWTNSLSLASIATNLNDRLRMLARGDRTAALRQQTMRATIAWSYDLLSPQEQLLFERFSIFAGDCTLEAAVTVCSGPDIEGAAVLPFLSSLVAKSLVNADRSDAGPRYSMLDTTRQYALERLSQRGEREVTAGRHARACLAIAEHFERLRNDVNKPDNLDRVPEFLAARDRERSDVRAALEWALRDKNDIELGQRLVAATWGTRGIWETQIADPLQWARAALDAVTEQTPPLLVAKLSRVECIYLERRHEFERSLKAIERQAAIVNDLGNPSEVGNALTMAYLRLGRLEDAVHAAETIVAELRGQPEQKLLGEALLGLGGAYFAQERYSESHAILVEARHRLESEGDGYLLGICDSELATSFFGLGDAATALQHVRSATATLRAWRHAFLPEMLSNEATILIALDRFDEAYARAMESLEIVQENLLRSVLPIQRLATIAALRPYETPEHAHDGSKTAAILLGYVEARLTEQRAFRFPTDQKDVDRAMTVLRSLLGEQHLAVLLSRGASSSEEDAMALARVGHFWYD